MNRFYENYDPVEAEKVNGAIYEAKLRAARLPIPRRRRKANSQISK